MKIHSIKFKITLLLVVTVTCLVAMLIGFNSIFSEKVYMNRKQKSMINSYENVNEIMQKYTDLQIDKDTMCADMENISTAKGEEMDELQGFECGADEYIAKPFSPKILTARVDAIIRRAYGVDSNEIIEIGGITIDKAAHIVKIDGEEIELSYKEFELLTYFIENKGIALSREKILNNVWNYDYYGDARTIDTHVKKLRKKMGEKGDYIKTIWGMGYKFIVD